MNNLSKVVTQHCAEEDLNPQPIDRKSNVGVENNVQIFDAKVIPQMNMALSS